MNEHDWRNRRAHDDGDPRPDPTRAFGSPAVPGPDGSGDDPVDLAAVQFDDQFIDALSRDVPVSTRDDAEYDLAALLSGWRHEVVDPPAPDLPSVDEVERAIAATERVSRGKRIVRHLRVVSGAAAIVVVAAAGLTVLSEGAQPGDPLWGVKKVVFAQAASETQAAYDVRSNLEQAQAAMAKGDTSGASSLIEKAETQMGPVNKETRAEMDEWIKRLRAGASSAPSASASSSTKPSASEPGGADSQSHAAEPETPDSRTFDPRAARPRPSDDARSEQPQPSQPGTPGESGSPQPSTPSPSKPDTPAPQPNTPTRQTPPPVTSTTTPASTITSAEPAPEQSAPPVEDTDGPVPSSYPRHHR